MKSEVIFGDEKLKREFEELKEIKENKLYQQLMRAFKNLIIFFFSFILQTKLLLLGF